MQYNNLISTGRAGQGGTSGFGHLLSIEEQVAIASHALRPLLRSILPDGGVVVQGKAEVVVDQVLARGLHLQGSSPGIKNRANIRDIWC